LSQVRRAFFLWLMATCICARGAVPQYISQQYEAKAKFLANSPEFVEWPAATFKSPNSSLLICVYGDFSFGTTLAVMIGGTSAHGHRKEVKWIRKEQDLPGCQVLFISHSVAKHYEKVLDVVKSSATLTIGEDGDFLKAGGMVSLDMASSTLIFDVNLDAVHGGPLRLSSQLLSLARHIIQRSEPTRS
jgi:hypothetical protein